MLHMLMSIHYAGLDIHYVSILQIYQHGHAFSSVVCFLVFTNELEVVNRIQILLPYTSVQKTSSVRREHSSGSIGRSACL